MSDTKVLIDWVSFTSKIHTPAQIIELLGFGPDIQFQTIKGAHGYRDRLYYNCISIHYNGREDMGVWCEMSGQGCRAFETHGSGDFSFLFQEILDNPSQMNLTRLDIAYDDHDGLLDMNTVCRDTLSGEFVSKSEYWEVVQSSKGQTVFVGSPTSDVVIRIYDKAAERGRTDGLPWIRVELQLRRDRAKAFAALQGDVGRDFAGVLSTYLRYVDPSDTDTNRWRWPLKGYWADLLNNAAKIHLYDKPGVEYNLFQCEDFVFKQAGNAIDTLIQIYGVSTFLEKLRKRGTMPNVKYTQLIDLHRKVDPDETNIETGTCVDPGFDSLLGDVR